jgi:hypothetical protein
MKGDRIAALVGHRGGVRARPRGHTTRHRRESRGTG